MWNIAHTNHDEPRARILVANAGKIPERRQLTADTGFPDKIAVNPLNTWQGGIPGDCMPLCITSYNICNVKFTTWEATTSIPPLQDVAKARSRNSRHIG